MSAKVRCAACDEEWPADCIVRADEANTGGDAICYCCHVECVPEDANALAAGLARCFEHSLTSTPEELRTLLRADRSRGTK